MKTALNLTRCLTDDFSITFFIIVDVFILSPQQNSSFKNVLCLLRFRICSVNLDHVKQFYVYDQIHTLFRVVSLMSKHCCGCRTLIFCVGGETGSDDLQEQRLHKISLGQQSMPLKVHSSLTFTILHNLYLYSIKSYISLLLGLRFVNDPLGLP